MPPLSVAILVGGQSRRMGTTKALLRLTPDGPTLVERVITAARTVATEIVLVGNDPVPYAFLDLPVIPDVGIGAGPLAGIAAALSAAHHEHALVLACDMPALSAPLLAALAAHPRNYDALVPELGQRQPLLAIYRRTCLPAIERLLAANTLRTTELLAQVHTVILPEAEVRQHDPALRSATNLNTAHDVATFTRSPAPNPSDRPLTHPPDTTTN